MIHHRTGSLLRTIESGAPALYRGDCVTMLRSLPPSSIDLFITSPPYFMGKKYDHSASVDDFIKTQKRALNLAVSALKPGGSLCWQTGFHVAGQVCEPLDFIIHGLMKSHAGMRLRNRIVWHFGHGANAKRRFSGRHETILWYTKGDDFRFNLDAVRVRQKYPGKKSYKGASKGQWSGNPRGKNPSDVWDIPNVKANHIEKYKEHECQFPVALCERLVLALTSKGNIVCDPYAGTGSAGVAALHHGRRFIGSELVRDYAHIADERLQRAAKGQEPFRPHTQPVFDPSRAGSVAVAPPHFFGPNAESADDEREHRAAATPG